MERCYVCNSCGRCAEEERELLTPTCRMCGHEVQPGENAAVCSECGSPSIAKPEMDLSKLFG